MKQWLRSSNGMIVAVVVCVAAICWAAVEVRSVVHDDKPGDPNLVMYVCSETGKAFPHRNVVGEQIPILSPYSGKNTGYPAVACFWTKDGQVKDDPTWVLMNNQVGKPEPTFCPDCGRLVNPQWFKPTAGSKPPPTREQYMASHQ
jgi:hypothetical protein